MSFFEKKVSISKEADLLNLFPWKRIFLFFSVHLGIPLKYPRQYWIEITNRCNLKCLMCPVAKGLNRKPMDMSLDNFIKIIDQISFGKPAIVLHVAGEPFLNTSIFQMIEYAHKKGCIVGIHTNGTLLTEEVSQKILNSPPDWISFSFDGASKEIYEKIRIGADFEKVKNQIEKFLELRKEKKTKKPFVSIEIIEMDETRKYIPEFIEYCRTQETDKITIRPAMTWLGLLDHPQTGKIKKFKAGICKGLFYKCAILVDGTIIPCCLDIAGRLPLGNIFEKPFKEIWKGEKYKNLRKQHIKKTVPENHICYNCFARSKNF